MLLLPDHPLLSTAPPSLDLADNASTFSSLQQYLAHMPPILMERFQRERELTEENQN